MFSREELMDILISLGDTIRQEEDNHPNDPWIDDVRQLRLKVRGMIRGIGEAVKSKGETDIDCSCC